MSVLPVDSDDFSSELVSAQDEMPDVPAGWKPTRAEPVPVVRCTVVKKNGERCRRWSLRGTNICVAHGGRLPSVQKHAEAVVESARLRLIGLSDMAVDVIEELATSAAAEGIRLKAAQDILDRSGIKGPLEVDITVKQEVTAAERVQARLTRLASRVIEGTISEPDPEESEALVLEPQDAEESADASE